MRSEAQRAWCAICCFTGKSNFYLGTVMVRTDAPMHEVEQEITNLMDEIFPTRPKLIHLVPGVVVFTPEGEEE